MFQLYDISRDVDGATNGTLINDHKDNDGKPLHMPLRVYGMSSPTVEARRRELDQAKPDDFDPEENPDHRNQALEMGLELAVVGLIEAPEGVKMGDQVIDLSDAAARRSILKDKRFQEFADIVIRAMNAADRKRIKWESGAVKNSSAG